MPTVEELYRNYGILADAKETAPEVGVISPPPVGFGLWPSGAEKGEAKRSAHRLVAESGGFGRAQAAFGKRPRGAKRDE